MSDMRSNQPDPRGGLARFFVEHREVAWLLFLTVLAWGWVSYFQLAQQEDPKIPERKAQLVTRFPGATAEKVEALVTKKLEQKIAEMPTIEEVNSQSRSGVSVITIAQVFKSQARVDQEWDKLRAKLQEVALPEGCAEPRLDTDFGKTVTLLLALVSPPISEAECIARANHLRGQVRGLRTQGKAEGRATVVAFFAPSISQSYRRIIRERFIELMAAEHLGHDIQTVQSESLLLADFATTASREELWKLVFRFRRLVAGSDGGEGQMHPDLAVPLVLMGDEDPLPHIRALAMPRYSYRQLEVIADDLEDNLKQLKGVGRVRKIGIVPEMIYLFFSFPKVVGYGIGSQQIMDAIASRNAIIPGGTFRAVGQNFPVQLSGEFRSEKDLFGTVIGLSKDGTPIYLRDMFEVRRGYETPIQFQVDVLRRPAGVEAAVPSGVGRAGASGVGRLSSLRSVLVAVEMKEDQIIADFNKAVRGVIDQLQVRLPDGIEVLTLSDQPRAVAHRIILFMQCFFEAGLIVILVALLLMDWRSALVVAFAIPLTVAMTFGGMHALGLPLHQISIASLIIALGMLVDDPVVASDGINRELAQGQPRGVAAWLGPYKLRRPILYATVINIMAFLPLTLLPEDKGAFIFALPVVVTLALIASRIVSMTFVPLLGFHLLRGQKGFEEGAEVRQFPPFAMVDRGLQTLLPRYKRLLQRALDHPFRVIGVAYALLALSFVFLPFIGTQFFPPAERNQLLIDVELPEMASLDQTRGVCADIVELLNRHPQIENAAVFSGGMAPRFYYNVTPREPGNYLAQVLVNTRRADDVPKLMATLREELGREIAGARCTVKQLEQGPPVEAPIQIRFSGEDLDVLRGLADQAAQALREAGGYNVHDDLGRRMPTIEIAIDQDRANTLGIDNSKVGRVTQAAFEGLKVTELREGDHLIPIVIRLHVEERNEAEKIRTLYIESTRTRPVPISSFADVRLEPKFATIAHHNQLRTVTVKSHAPYGRLASEILNRAHAAIQQIQIPTGYTLELAGEAKELKKNRGQMGRVMLISLALIALAMVLQFRSVTKSLVVMLTVPLGLIGAFVGLTVMRTTIGFMALLAMVSLAGVIVSHIIVLSDFIEEARARGMELKAALVQAGLVRLRAVLVTVLATVGGLIPLSLAGGALWRPLTSVHIFGLLFATLLTLIVLPVLYYLFCARFKWIR